MQGPVEISVCPDWVVAKHTYHGVPEADELAFDPGDKILVLRRDDSGWWQGEVDGEVGWFPKTFALPFQSSESIALPRGALVFLVCGQTRKQGVLNDAGTKLFFDVDYVPRGTRLECSEIEKLDKLNWKSSLKPFSRFEGSQYHSDSAEQMPWLPVDVFGLIMAMCPGSRAALSLTCREFNRAAVSLSPAYFKTSTWTTRDEVRSLEGAFRLLLDAPWFVRPQIVEQAKSLLERFQCSEIAIACVLHGLRFPDLDLLTDSDLNVLAQYRQVAESDNRERVGYLTAQSEDPGMIQAWMLLRVQTCRIKHTALH